MVITQYSTGFTPQFHSPNKCVLTSGEIHDKWYKKARPEGHLVGGWYRPDDTYPSITLHIRDLYRGIPSIYWWTPVPTFLITHTLAHEVAHHIVATRGHIHGSAESLSKKIPNKEEAAADRYAATVVARMRLRWYYRLASWAIKNLSEWHYMAGMLDWREGKYRKAAEHWFNASILDPNNLQAGYWYWRAREEHESKQA